MKILKHHQIEKIEQIIAKEREDTDSDDDGGDKDLEDMLEDHIQIDILLI